MTKHLHLPHPHIASRLAEEFERAVLERLHHREPAIVPDGHDWNEWHWYDGKETPR